MIEININIMFGFDIPTRIDYSKKKDLYLQTYGIDEEPSMKVTMKDIAEKTGVSINTVSLALRNMTSVKKETRELIWQTALQMGYLEQKSKPDIHNIGLISTGERLQDSYFYMSFYQNILSRVHDRGYNMMVFKGDACDTQPDALRDIFETNSISGLIVLGDMEERIVAKIAATNLPLIATGTRYHTLKVPTIIEDNLEGAHIAVKHLYEKGYRNIGFIGNPLHSTGFKERYEGFMGAMFHFGLLPRQEWMVTDLDQTHVYDLDRLRSKLGGLKIYPEAFICTNDNMAVLAAKIFSELGLSIPNDIALVGFDNSIIGKMSTPSITSIDVQCALQAETCVQVLIDYIENGTMDPYRMVLPVTLSCKEST